MRLIDADALDDVTMRLNFKENWGITRIEYKLIDSVLFEFPTVKPQTAHWIIDGHHIQCSKCGETMCNTDREGDPIPRNFCPNCGTRMVTE